MQRHPCHQCPDRENHARWAERYWRLKRTVDKMRQQIETRTGTVARIFDRVVDVLARPRLRRASTTTAPTALTPAGRTMRRIYGERDLLVRRVAAHRLCGTSWTPRPSPRWPAASSTSRAATKPAGRARPAARRLPRRAQRDRRRSGSSWTTSSAITGCPAPSRSRRASRRRCTPGRAACALDRVLDEADMAAGDFVRWAKQTIDLLDQLSIVADRAARHDGAQGARCRPPRHRRVLVGLTAARRPASGFRPRLGSSVPLAAAPRPLLPLWARGAGLVGCGGLLLDDRVPGAGLVAAGLPSVVARAGRLDRAPGCGPPCSSASSSAPRSSS